MTLDTVSPGFWIGWGMVLFLAGLFQTSTSLVVSNDEAWFLQVARRVARGEVLYRDVFFGATPLSVYLAALFVRLFGQHLLIVKLVNTLCFTAIGLLVLWLGVFLGLPAWFSPFVVFTLLVFCSPWTMGTAAPYTPLAYVFLLTAFCLTLSFIQDLQAPGPAGPAGLLYAAAAAAGLGFSAKQTVGGYTLAALLGALLISWLAIPSSPFPVVSLFTVLAVFGAVLLVGSVLSLLVTGGWVKFLEYGFINKRAYLRKAGIAYTYLDGLKALAGGFRRPVTLTSLRKTVPLLLYLVAPVAAILLAWKLWQPGLFGRPFWLVVTLFLLAALGDVFPRVSMHHLSCAMPVYLPFIGISLKDILWPAGFQMIVVFVCAVLALILGDQVYQKWFFISRKQFCFAPLPGFRGTLLASSYVQAIDDFKSRLQTIPCGRRLLILTTNAAWLYLACGLENPTPFDYPLETAFGIAGEQATVDGIRKGEIQYVCMNYLPGDPLKPRLLEDYVLANMTVCVDLPFATLYCAEQSSKLL